MHWVYLLSMLDSVGRFWICMLSFWTCNWLCLIYRFNSIFTLYDVIVLSWLSSGYKYSRLKCLCLRNYTQDSWSLNLFNLKWKWSLKMYLSSWDLNLCYLEGIYSANYNKEDFFFKNHKDDETVNQRRGECYGITFIIREWCA